MNGNSSYANGASIWLGLSPDLDPRAATMAWVFRRQIARVP